jgi:beta-barrel assembly-enhancing protease
MRKLAVLALVAVVSGCAVSTQQEVQMGASYAAEINRQLPIVQDAELNRYINVLGDSIARIADTRNLDWQFHIVNSPDVNAFAVPGGFIYINRGLIERSKTLAQVAGVIGHEVGHVTRRHSVKQMQKAQGANIGMLGICIFTSMCASETGQALVGLSTNAAMASFSRADEDDADMVGVEYMVKARINPNGIPEMFQILLDERKVKPEGLETWFTSHPLEESRIAAARARIAALPAGSLDGLTNDSPAFQAFKRRLSSLPAAPAGSATSPR